MKLPLRGVFGVLIYAALFISGAWWGADQANTSWDLRWSQRDANDTTALAQRLADARMEEQRRQREIEGVRKEARQQIDRMRNDAGNADAAYRKLHDKANRLASQLGERERTCSTVTPGRSESETSGAVLLADLFRRADQRAGELAREADEARARGLACEAAYNSIRKEPQ